jgi:acetate---CoA ligase (ADP-forming)
MQSISEFSDLTLLLRPSSVAILGASDTPTRIGGRSLGYMLQRPFDGKLFPINPNRSTVQGLPAFASVADLPEAPDLAIIALAAELVPDAIDELAKRGTPAAVIFSSGFAEIGQKGEVLQKLIVDRARRGKVRLLGPNSLGLLNTRNNFWGTFTSSLESAWPRLGRIGIASQSGAYGAHMLSAAMGRDLGISVFVTTGNEADITTADAIGWMAEHEDTDVIVAYLEGIKSGERLVRSLECARAARKPVIVMKAGRSALGSKAAQSHTASLAGNDAVADAVLRELGAIRIETTQQALDFAELAAKRIYPVANTLGVLTVSGGAGILIADDAERLSLAMPELPSDAQARMTGLLDFASTRNPVDCTAQALNKLSLVGDFGAIMLQEGRYKSLLVFFSQAGGAKSIVAGFRVELRRILEAAPDCLGVLCVLASADVVKQYQEDGFVVYDDPARAVAAIAAMGRLGEAFARIESRPTIAPLRISAGSALNETEAKALLAKAGLPVAEERIVQSAAAAGMAAAEIGFPVVMKIVSPDIPHKTEIGGVLTDVRTEEAARIAFNTLIDRGATTRPDARLDGVLVARKVVDGIECIMGIMRDPVFGAVALFGLGGVHVEVLKDVVLRRCPFGPSEAEAMISSIRGYPLLRGVRGQPPVATATLAEMLSRLSVLAIGLGPKLISIDVNPVIATPSGAWAVDAVIEMDLHEDDQIRKAV